MFSNSLDCFILFKGMSYDDINFLFSNENSSFITVIYLVEIFSKNVDIPYSKFELVVSQQNVYAKHIIIVLKNSMQMQYYSFRYSIYNILNAIGLLN